MANQIMLEREDVREGLRLIRAQKMAHDALHVAENEYAIWYTQMQAMYGAPEDWQMTDLVVGFVPGGVTDGN